jgi:hypothetical protein
VNLSSVSAPSDHYLCPSLYFLHSSPCLLVELDAGAAPSADAEPLARTVTLTHLVYLLLICWTQARSVLMAISVVCRCYSYYPLSRAPARIGVGFSVHGVVDVGWTRVKQQCVARDGTQGFGGSAS